MMIFEIELSPGKTVHGEGDEAIEHEDGLSMDLEIRTNCEKTAYYKQVVGYSQRELPSDQDDAGSAGTLLTRSHTR